MNRTWVSLVVVGALGLGVVTVFSTTTLARAWLCAFVVVSMVPIGSLALLLIHGITGGRWGDDLKPVLIPAARCLPLLLVASIPILVFRDAIYAWNALPVPDDVRAVYLSPVFFDLRTVLALALWSVFAWCGVWRRTTTAAAASIVHLLLLSFIPADWVLTIQPGSVSAGFGFGFGCEQILASMGFAVLAAPQGSNPRASRDMAGITIAALLASMYFIYVQYLVVWYGNVPEKVRWYAVRDNDAWPSLALAAFVLGAAFPFLSILHPTVREKASALRIVGLSVLVGVCLHMAWLMLPGFTPLVAMPMTFIAAGLVAAFVLAKRSSSRREQT